MLNSVVVGLAVGAVGRHWEASRRWCWEEQQFIYQRRGQGALFSLLLRYFPGSLGLWT